MHWLIEQSVFDAIQLAQISGIKPTVEQHKEFMSRAFGDDSDNSSRILTNAGNVAQINVRGVLTKNPDFFAFLFGGGNTTYSELIKAVAIAENDPKVAKVEFFYDSPGGSVDGMYQAIQTVHSMNKPKFATIRRAASAAYGLASVSGKLVAEDAAAEVGSLGVAAQMRVNKDVIELTSTNAPKKRPDPTTKEGREVITEQLDAVEDLFFDCIAKGRGVTVEKIIASYGQGATFLANDALKRGMIDEIAKPKLSVVPKSSANSGNEKRVLTMDLETLKAQHPGVYQAAVKDGVTQERDRVTAHLILGKSYNCLDVAIDAVEKGESMTATQTAKYLSAGRNAQDVKDRKDDDQIVDDKLKGADKSNLKAGPDLANSVVDGALAELGVKVE